MDNSVSVEDAQFLAEMAAESIGWLPLDDGAYLHVGDPDALVIDVVGVPEVGHNESRLILGDDSDKQWPTAPAPILPQRKLSLSSCS